MLHTPIGPLSHLVQTLLSPFPAARNISKKLKIKIEEDNSLLESSKQGRPQEDVQMENEENHCSKLGKNQVRVQTQLCHLSL